MCRFAAYLGEKSLLLKSVLNGCNNSLIRQSRLAQETRCSLNADGFGLGWYDHDVDDFPAVFKSIRPAWNDENLINISDKVRSKCFFGHVRASTVGNISTGNCHPFTYETLLFAHNGTIDEFHLLRKQFYDILDDEHLNRIQGQTDSEVFFLLFSFLLKRDYGTINAHTMTQALLQAIAILDTFYEQKKITPSYRLNIILTNGHELVTTRIVAPQLDEAPTLHYTPTTFSDGTHGVIVASEKLTRHDSNWIEIPKNHVLTVNRTLQIALNPLSFHQATKKVNTVA